MEKIACFEGLSLHNNPEIIMIILKIIKVQLHESFYNFFLLKCN